MYYVYHIVDPRNNSLEKGYIGVTKQELVKRFKDHQRGNRIIGKAIRSLSLGSDSICLLFSYPTAEEAYAKEEELRPGQAALNRPKYTCPECNKVGQYNSMVAWHGDNCRSVAK